MVWHASAKTVRSGENNQAPRRPARWPDDALRMVQTAADRAADAEALRGLPQEAKMRRQRTHDEIMANLRSVARGRISRLREYVLHAFCGKIPCYWCGKLTKQGDRNLDHVIARAAGGTDAQENLVCSCVRCNKSRGKRPGPPYFMIPSPYTRRTAEFGPDSWTKDY